MAGEQRAGRFGQLIQRPGPGMEINLAIGVKVAQQVVELPNRHAGVAALEMAKQFGQRTIVQLARFVPAGKMRQENTGTDFFCSLGQGTLRGKPMANPKCSLARLKEPRRSGKCTERRPFRARSGKSSFLGCSSCLSSRHGDPIRTMILSEPRPLGSGPGTPRGSRPAP